uniref:Cadherin 9 n=1 Tax=Cairina moschata TaxID=8855 RepID=A0A8C3CDN4_CAIMO
MMRTYSLTVLLWSCMLHAVHMMPSQKRTNKHSKSERITGLSENDGETLHRTKRGWMWNQFFLLEEYTGPDTQYVGKEKLC